MSIVNFAVPKPLEKIITQTMKERGIVSKAEFFRFAAFHFIDHLHEAKHTDDEYEEVMNSLATAIQARYQKKGLPSLEEQLSDLR
ncbi:MAG: hypothetical protein Q8P56_05970 [Candidatus Uhrbacteria bacterium]|nr:hypothetical protein [Candidatus Uhrbacteria bacterium]